MTAFEKDNKHSGIIKTSSKSIARDLAYLLKRHGCHRIVIAAGSRNAPLIIAFTRDKAYRCYALPDERAAAFTALGMCLEERQPTAVVCTSGSAAANFLPAVTEAWYQKLPLVVLTADRPLELIDQGVGQTIRQEGLYSRHVAWQGALLREPGDALGRSYNQRLINEMMHACTRGPVHLNLPFDEPLYDEIEAPEEVIKFTARVTARASELPGEVLLPQWRSCPRVMLLAGFAPPNEALDRTLNRLQEVSPFLLLSETLSNCTAGGNIRSIDRLISPLSENEKAALQPDLLITTGGEIVSKMIKQYLRDYPAQAHWHISPEGEHRDTFGYLSTAIAAPPEVVFASLAEHLGQDDSRADRAHYRDTWLAVDRQRHQHQEAFSHRADFSDWKALSLIWPHLPAEGSVHLANSASVRYAQLFDHPAGQWHYANRGTSGIDGCTATALGHALTTERPVTLITGDVAFLYDTNAFWHDRWPERFRVIVINNGGGNIFRIIQGPERDEHFERFQETAHQWDLQGVAQIYGLGYHRAASGQELQEVLPEFFSYRPEEDRPRILEVQTPRKESPQVLAEYFAFLREPAPSIKD